MRAECVGLFAVPSLHRFACSDYSTKHRKMDIESQHGCNLSRKPCKVWNFSRSKRRSVTAGDLSELIKEGKRKLDIHPEESVRVVLEEDGTEIDENDYFQLVPDFTTFLLLKDDEIWLPNGANPDPSRRMFADWESRRSLTTTESGSGSNESESHSDAVDSNGSCDPSRLRAVNLFRQLCADNAYKQLLPWLLLRPADLEDIIQADPDLLSTSVGCPREVVDEIQEMSSIAFSDYNNAQRAVQMLNVYDQSVRHCSRTK